MICANPLCEAAATHHGYCAMCYRKRFEVTNEDDYVVQENKGEI